jgi:capsular polysaccharide biosynthesis protein
MSLDVKSYPDEPDYREFLGLTAPPRIRYGRVDRMVYYEDPAFNAHKTTRFRALRATLREKVARDAGQPGPLIYLKRGRTGDPRMLVNEAEIEAFLARLGFDIIEPSSLSVDEVVRRTMDARCVVTIEGSHKSHCVYTIAETGALVILQPPDRFGLQYKDFADALGIGCGFVVGSQEHDGFRISTTELDCVLHRIM